MRTTTSYRSLPSNRSSGFIIFKKERSNIMKNFSFEVTKEKWNIVSEVGLPKEDEGMLWLGLVCSILMTVS